MDVFMPPLNPEAPLGQQYSPRLIQNNFGDGYAETAPDGLNAYPALGGRVERTLGWINRARRLSKDFEATINSALAWLQLALAFLIMRRLARPKIRQA